MNTKLIRPLAIAASLALSAAMPLAALADNPVPVTTSISPSVVAVGGGSFTLTVNGNNFTIDSMVQVNGSARTTTYHSSTQLTAAINASDVSTQGTLTITVNNPVPGGGTSNAQALTVSNINPMPVLNSISPMSVLAGSNGFTLNVFGSNFNQNSVVRFNGIARITTYISANHLMAAIPASAVSITGHQLVEVVNPIPGGGTSNGIFFTVGPITAAPSPTTPNPVTPGLPNTGFGPESSNGLLSMLAIALIALGGTALTVIGMKRLWVAKK